MTSKSLLDEIKEDLSEDAWSQVVMCVRRGDVSLFHREEDVYLFNVSLGRLLPYRVELNPADEDWSCSCNAPLDPCRHVAAAALALYQSTTRTSREGAKRRSPLDRGLERGQGPHLGYRFSASRPHWRLSVVVVDPERGDETELAGRPAEGVTTSRADLEVLALRSAGFPRARAPHLLQALALCRDVKVDGQAVEVSAEGVASALLVEDHPRGILVRLAPREPVLKALRGALDLVVVGSPPILRPLIRSTLPADQAAFYAPGRVYEGDRAAKFLTQTLARLKKLTLVEVRTSSSLTVARLRPYARLTLTPAIGGLDVLPTITYGTPPQAVAARENLHLLEGARIAPQRMAQIEHRLAAQIEGLLGIAPGRKLQLRGLEAARFVRHTLPQFKGVVEGREHAGRVRVHDAPLQPVWVRSPEDGELELAFVVPGDAVEGGCTGEGGAGGAHGAPRASTADVVAAWREGRALIPLLDGGFAPLPAAWMGLYGHLVEALLELPERDAPYRAPVVAQLMEHAEAAPDVRRIKQAISSQRAIVPREAPAGFVGTLRDYQREGLGWIKSLEAQKLGGILADDMGLGKTIQALAAILMDGPDAPPTLVVAPTSVLHNWIREAGRFAPSLRVCCYHGPNRKLGRLKDLELVVTSFAVMRLDLETLAGGRWARVILDEAQAIKNPDSQTARAARRIPADHRLAMTGTPVENRLDDLWSILEFANPGMLGSRERFRERFARPIAEGDARPVRQLRLRVQPFLLRRMKQDVERELPPRTDLVLEARLSAPEREVYEAVRIAGRSEVRRLVAEKGIKKSGLQILEVLLRLRQACCHPGLIRGVQQKGPIRSSKVELLAESLEVLLEEGHKALVFSQWTRLLDLIELALEARGIDWCRLDGSTRNRGKVVETFQQGDGPGVFLISLKAGGFGLNLTEADYVFHVDPWWNPAAEDQATDRAYRIGQTRPVMVTRLIAVDTIEERILEMQKRKRAVADAALGDSGVSVSTLSEDELESLLEA